MDEMVMAEFHEQLEKFRKQQEAMLKQSVEAIQQATSAVAFSQQGKEVEAMQVAPSHGAMVGKSSSPVDSFSGKPESELRTRLRELSRECESNQMQLLRKQSKVDEQQGVIDSLQGRIAELEQEVATLRHNLTSGMNDLLAQKEMHTKDVVQQENIEMAQKIFTLETKVKYLEEGPRQRVREYVILV